MERAARGERREARGERREAKEEWPMVSEAKAKELEEREKHQNEAN